MTFLALGIFVSAFLLIVFEPWEKSIIALAGAIAMVVFGVLSPEEAIAAVEFETILLLLGMMMLVNMASKSGILSWLNVRIATLTRGNPLAIFFLFSLLTATFSAFLDNVTTVILIVPLTIQLLKGMGRDPKFYIFAEIIFSNVGGALTLVGDPPNIIIGGATGFSFLDFLVNLWIPISISTVFLLLFFIFTNRKKLAPVSGNLTNLTIVTLLIEKIKHRFLKVTLHRAFIIKALTVLFFTIVGFLLQETIHLPAFITAFAGAILLGIISSDHIDIHHSFRSVEWSTLFFFAGLFIMVAGVEKTGILETLSHWIAHTTDDIQRLALIILWVSGLVSMVLDNIPFVTVMIPVIFGIKSQFPEMDTEILWWALSLGACLGGNGTLIGASANVVSANLARKEGCSITFMQYTKFSFPLTLGLLLICSVFLYFKTLA
ncbi:ArsB/NhaD family transporter [Candidatus Gracilibacteria bacterium]|nr:ArsB/NhaD family transporter [Candidatus Gracilibacteria bacterium]